MSLPKSGAVGGGKPWPWGSCARCAGPHRWRRGVGSSRPRRAAALNRHHRRPAAGHWPGADAADRAWACRIGSDWGLSPRR